MRGGVPVCRTVHGRHQRRRGRGHGPPLVQLISMLHVIVEEVLMDGDAMPQRGFHETLVHNRDETLVQKVSVFHVSETLVQNATAGGNPNI